MKIEEMLNMTKMMKDMVHPDHELFHLIDQTLDSVKKQNDANDELDEFDLELVAAALQEPKNWNDNK